MAIFVLIQKEVRRFSAVWMQAIIGPCTSAVLYQIIFGHQIGVLNSQYITESYSTFLIPGLVMMQILLNAFANGSSSIMQAKYTGSIIFILMAPISSLGLYIAYLSACIIRGFIVGGAVLCGIVWFGEFHSINLFSMLLFAFCGSAITGGLGIIAGSLSSKFEQLAGFQAFIIVPLIYLSGIFFNINHLAPVWQYLALIDPMMYIVNGFRYGMTNHSTINMYATIAVVLFFTLAVNITGYKIMSRGIMIK